MKSLGFSPANPTIPRNSIPYSKVHSTHVIGIPASKFPVFSRPICPLKFPIRFPSILSSLSVSNPQNFEEEDDPQTQVQDLRVPDHWVVPSKALEESEWLKTTLHKWLDDEYCPEATNIEISEVAAQSYYQSLLEKRTDLGEILLKMARELQSISYQESFHGAFSSANAAVNLIAQRIEQD
ncbi:hypothetical protein L1049_003737 [Liquidambar formosana]|uniref:Uncharacterized protein n=1 Tax=Liquidambar formosana TaxID=63359 RepID=A0AAP0RQN3_LIQFO